MTDLALAERITRLLAFMLRHQPEQFDLALDSHGFADIAEVLRALSERVGAPVLREDIEAAVNAGDRQRYQVQDDRIRALYGHSIPIEPGPSSKPPEFLYVGIPLRDLERARRFGLRGGRRRFLHLALDESDAIEAGKRAARDYALIRIRALDAWEEGVSFFDRVSLWLAEAIPTDFLELVAEHHDGHELARQSEGHHEHRRHGPSQRSASVSPVALDEAEPGSGTDGEAPARDAAGGAERRGGRRRRGRGRGDRRDGAHPALNASADRGAYPEAREEAPARDRGAGDRGRGEERRERPWGQDRGRDRGGRRGRERPRDHGPRTSHAAPAGGPAVVRVKPQPAPASSSFGSGVFEDPTPPIKGPPAPAPASPKAAPRPADSGRSAFGAGI